MASVTELSADPIFHFSDFIDDQHKTLPSLSDSVTVQSEENLTLVLPLPLVPFISVTEHINPTETKHPEPHQTTVMIPYNNLKLEEEIATYKPRSGMDFSFHKLIDQDMQILVEHAIINKQCTGLELWGNEITSQGVSILADCLHNNTTLKELRLSENHVSDMGVRHLVRILSLNDSNIKGLDLDSNTITDEGAQYLSEMLKVNSALTYLMLSDNEISDRGVQLLANALAQHNTSLKELYLRMNHLVSDSSVDSLVNLFKQNLSLKKLNIQGCNLSKTGEAILRMAAKHKTNFTLIIDASTFQKVDTNRLWTSLKTFFS